MRRVQAARIFEWNKRPENRGTDRVSQLINREVKGGAWGLLLLLLLLLGAAAACCCCCERVRVHPPVCHPGARPVQVPVPVPVR